MANVIMIGIVGQRARPRINVDISMAETKEGAEDSNLEL